MYVTRPISTYRNFPDTLSIQPSDSEASNAGYVVATDEEIEVNYNFFWGGEWCKRRIDNLPFPQDKILVISCKISFDKRTFDLVWFLPVLDQPLSSNRYHIMVAQGKHQGLAFACSTEEDITTTCCLDKVIKAQKPKPLDPANIYQQFEIRRYRKGHFYAISVVDDGVPPQFLSTGWEVFSFEPCQAPPIEAQGLHASLRNFLPNFNFPISSSIKRSTPVVIGEWCCPFAYVKEDITVKDQMKSHLFYKMTLEQWWEEIYSCESESGKANIFITFNVSVQRQVARVHGMDAVRGDETASNDGFVSFWVRNQYGQTGTSVALSAAIFEKMKKLQEGRGWDKGEEGDARVERVEKTESEKAWKRFACYVLVESFVLKRNDRTLLLNCDFRHSHRFQSKWE